MEFKFRYVAGIVLACSAGGFWGGEWIYISIGCSGRHLEIEKQWRVGRGKKFTKGGREKEKLGKGEGEKNPLFSLPHPQPPPNILAPILPVCSESKIVAKHSIGHQTRLHCRLGLSWVALLFQLLGYTCIYIVTLLSIKWTRIKFPL